MLKSCLAGIRLICALVNFSDPFTKNSIYAADTRLFCALCNAKISRIFQLAKVSDRKVVVILRVQTITLTYRGILFTFVYGKYNIATKPSQI